MSLVFFQLALSPSPRTPSEPIPVQNNQQLTLKVEGVVQHGSTPGLFRKIQSVCLNVTSVLQSKTGPDYKVSRVCLFLWLLLKYLKKTYKPDEISPVLLLYSILSWVYVCLFHILKLVSGGISSTNTATYCIYPQIMLLLMFVQYSHLLHFWWIVSVLLLGLCSYLFSFHIFPLLDSTRH